MNKTYQLNLPISHISNAVQQDLHQARGKVPKALALLAARYQAAAAQCTRAALILPDNYDISMFGLLNPDQQFVIVITGPEHVLEPLVQEGLLVPGKEEEEEHEEEEEEENECRECGDIASNNGDYCFYCEPDEEEEECDCGECSDEEDDYDDEDEYDDEEDEYDNE